MAENVTHHLSLLFAGFGMHESGAAVVFRQLDLLGIKQTGQPGTRTETGEIRAGRRLLQRRTQPVVAIEGVAARALAGEKTRALRLRILAQKEKRALRGNA